MLKFKGQISNFLTGGFCFPCTPPPAAAKVRVVMRLNLKKKTILKIFKVGGGGSDFKTKYIVINKVIEKCMYLLLCLMFCYPQLLFRKSREYSPRSYDRNRPVDRHSSAYTDVRPSSSRGPPSPEIPRRARDYPDQRPRERELSRSSMEGRERSSTFGSSSGVPKPRSYAEYREMKAKGLIK